MQMWKQDKDQRWGQDQSIQRRSVSVILTDRIELTDTLLRRDVIRLSTLMVPSCVKRACLRRRSEQHTHIEEKVMNYYSN